MGKQGRWLSRTGDPSVQVTVHTSATPLCPLSLLPSPSPSPPPSPSPSPSPPPWSSPSPPPSRPHRCLFSQTSKRSLTRARARARPEHAATRTPRRSPPSPPSPPSLRAMLPQCPWCSLESELSRRAYMRLALRVHASRHASRADRLGGRCVHEAPTVSQHSCRSVRLSVCRCVLCVRLLF